MRALVAFRRWQPGAEIYISYSSGALVHDVQRVRRATFISTHRQRFHFRLAVDSGADSDASVEEDDEGGVGGGSVDSTGGPPLPAPVHLPRAEGLLATTSPILISRPDFNPALLHPLHRRCCCLLLSSTTTAAATISEALELLAASEPSSPPSKLTAAAASASSRHKPAAASTRANVIDSANESRSGLPVMRMVAGQPRPAAQISTRVGSSSVWRCRRRPSGSERPAVCEVARRSQIGASVATAASQTMEVSGRARCPLNALDEGQPAYRQLLRARASHVCRPRQQSKGTQSGRAVRATGKLAAWWHSAGRGGSRAGSMDGASGATRMHT